MSLPLALTMGEPAGIGGEIALLAWLRRARPTFHPSCHRRSRSARAPGREPRLARHAAPPRPPGQAAAAFADALPVLPLALKQPVTPGRPDPAHAAAVIEAIATGAALASDGRAGALVTNPIQKEALYAAGFRHPGHTEFLAELAGGAMPAMMLACPELRVVLVTIHQPLRAALAALSVERIVATGRIAAAGLTRDFGIARPRLAVAGLNPHAGEEGALGREEIDIIAPAVAELRAHGIDAVGPRPPTRCFMPPRGGATTPRCACITTRR